VNITERRKSPSSRRASCSGYNNVAGDNDDYLSRSISTFGLRLINYSAISFVELVIAFARTLLASITRTKTLDTVARIWTRAIRGKRSAVFKRIRSVRFENTIAVNILNADHRACTIRGYRVYLAYRAYNHYGNWPRLKKRPEIRSTYNRAHIIAPTSKTKRRQNKANNIPPLSRAPYLTAVYPALTFVKSRSVPAFTRVLKGRTTIPSAFESRRSRPPPRARAFLSRVLLRRFN